MRIYQDAERFINEQFYNGTYDSRSQLRISTLVEEKLVADNKEKDPEYYGHQDGVIHSSSVYGCVRALIHAAIGSEKTSVPDGRKLGVFEAGNLFEDFIIDALGSRVLERQREYKYKHKSITLVGRSDYRIDDNGIMRIGENKSVHSDSFWYRKNEGTLIAWHNQIQLQIYMWLERVLFGNQWEGIFSYISKDDCTVESSPVKFNQAIIDEVVIPVLDIVSAGYDRVKPLADERYRLRTELKNMQGTDPNGIAVKQAELDALNEKINAMVIECAPAPAFSVYNDSKKQWQINWLCKYNDYADLCYGKGWLLVAQDEVKRKNAEAKGGAMAKAVAAVNGEPKA